jgi:long-chain acyl-CoA synthetase
LLAILPDARRAALADPNSILERFAAVCRNDAARVLIQLPASDDRVTASEIWLLHRRFLAQLADAGVQPDQMIVSLTGNRADSLPLLLATRALGAALMPLDVGTPSPELLEIASRFRASAIVMPSEDARHLQGRISSLRDDLSIVQPAGTAPATYKGVAVLKLTSGSTGLPRATLTAESHLVNDTTHIIEGMGIEATDTVIAAIPLSHAYGLGHLVLPPLLQGTALILRDSFMPQHLPGDARRFRARVFPGVPFMFRYFAAHPPGDGWPPSLRLLISAGARLEPRDAMDFHRRFGVKIHSFYGTSETGGIAYDDNEEIDGWTSTGRALPGVTIVLRPEVGAPTGGGRVLVRSAAVCSGYAGEEGSTDAFVDGGFLTGDYGSFDAKGGLVLAGRVSSFINVAGRKVQPSEVEQVLKSMPAVDDVRVVAVPDARRGEQVAACLVTSETLTAADVRRYCASRLAPYKIPRVVIFVDAIPMTVRGKTDHSALRSLVLAHDGKHM